MTDHDDTPIEQFVPSSNDCAMLKMSSGASFGEDATVVLPSGRSVNGAEMRYLVERWNLA